MQGVHFIRFGKNLKRKDFCSKRYKHAARITYHILVVPLSLSSRLEDEGKPAHKKRIAEYTYTHLLAAMTIELR